MCVGGVTMCADGTPLSATCLAKACEVCEDPPSPPPPEPPAPEPPPASDTIKIASFNIQVFGVTKAGNESVMDILAKTIAEFDIVAIQEIRDSTGTAILDLEKAVDALGVEYNLLVGPRVGRTVSLEQYAFLYRSSTVLYGTSYTYNDSALDLFHREPFIASFSTVNGNFDFVLATIHTDPDEATEEIDSLPLVIDDAKDHFPGEFDIILLGDFNADCSYFDEDDMFCPLREDEFYWVIPNDMDTNVATTSCTYDRIVITEDAESELTGLAGVFRFDQVFDLTDTEAQDVSDHYPVWAEFSIFDDSGDLDGNTFDDDGDGYSEYQGDCDDTNPDVFPGNWETISGSVSFNGKPVCAMVLVNGQYMFTCKEGDDFGKFELDVPRDANCEITVQAFVSGLSPFRLTTDTSAFDVDIDMQPNNPDSKSPAVTTVFESDASTPVGWARITGTVTLNDAPLCAMVLANGQYMFSCNANSGIYDLTVPLDGNGQITLFVFVSGLQPYKQTFTP